MLETGCLVWLLAASGAAPVTDAPASEVAAEPELVQEGLPLELLGAASVGRGLRLNNPFRLAKPLGDTAQSVSLSATYLELSVGGLFGDASGLRHGALLSHLVALDGIPQQGLTLAYLLHVELSARLFGRVRAGLPIVLTPDTTLGVEAAASFGVDVGMGFGLALDVVTSLFFGAATAESSVTTIPIVSSQIGIVYGYEVRL